jgi:hypothetical protein
VSSYVSSENTSEHCALTATEPPTWTLATNSPRVPVTASWLNVSCVEKTSEPVVVKLTGVPIVFPLALAKVTVPVQAGAVAFAVVEPAAILTTFTWAVSELANPTGGKL